MMENVPMVPFGEGASKCSKCGRIDFDGNKIHVHCPGPRTPRDMEDSIDRFRRITREHEQRQREKNQERAKERREEEKLAEKKEDAID